MSAEEMEVTIEDLLQPMDTEVSTDVEISDIEIDVEFETDIDVESVLETDIEILDITQEIDFELDDGKLPYYDGEYEVTPKRQTQTLHTFNKSMSNNVTVFSIPYTEVSNLYGTTVTIGGN